MSQDRCQSRHPIVNALTRYVHTDKRVGSKAELEFFRVMPMGSTTKLFFDDEQQYLQWRGNLEHETLVDNLTKEYSKSEPCKSTELALSWADEPNDA